MFPSLKNGDIILCMKPFFGKVFINDIVVFNHKIEGLMIKQITSIDDKGYFLKGSTPYSIDSSIFGYLQKKDILYKMILKF